MHQQEVRSRLLCPSRIVCFLHLLLCLLFCRVRYCTQHSAEGFLLRHEGGLGGEDRLAKLHKVAVDPKPDELCKRIHRWRTRLVIPRGD